MSEPKFVLKKKDAARGEEEYKYFSVRMKTTTIAELDKLADMSKHSRNELINEMCEFCIANAAIEE